MKVGEYVRAKYPPGSPEVVWSRRRHGIIVSFDIDDDPVIMWSHKGKTWNEANYRCDIIVLSETSGKEASNA